MNLELTAEAAEFGEIARRVLEAASDDGAAAGGWATRSDPAQVEEALEKIGAWDLDPRSGPGEMEAAAALCRSTGFVGSDYPVAERLCRPRDLDVDALAVVAESNPAGRVGRSGLRWATVTLSGGRSLARPREEGGPVSAEGITRLELHPLDGDAGARAASLDAALGLVLPCWTLLGMLDRAMELTRAHVLSREQFGQPLAAFQGVQFQLTDAEVERLGLEQLAKYALWSLEEGGGEELVDALSLRLAAIESADTVFRVSHQLHGAIGFCDETALSWLSRRSMALRRLPTGLSATKQQLTRIVGRRGVSGLFDPERLTDPEWRSDF